jgi:glycine/D-amino acid oxidase-like deaminating enzyme
LKRTGRRKEHEADAAMKNGSQRFDAIVVGGGVIGLSCAWRAARRGLSVAVLERDRPAAGATGVAAVPPRAQSRLARPLAGVREGARE